MSGLKTTTIGGPVVEKREDFLAFLPNEDFTEYKQQSDIMAAVSNPNVIIADSIEEARNLVYIAYSEDVSCPVTKVTEKLFYFPTAERYRHINQRGTAFALGNEFKTKQDLEIDAIPKIIEFVKSHGPVTATSSMGRALCMEYCCTNKTEKFNIRKLFWDKGIYLVLREHSTVLSPNPVKAKKQMQSQRYALNSKRKNNGVKYARLMDIEGALANMIPHVSANYHCHFYGIRDRHGKIYNHYRGLDTFTLAVELFNALHGKNAHRRVASFQNLIEKWKHSSDKRKEKIADKDLITWLDNEVSKKFIKPKAKFLLKKNTITVKAKLLVKEKSEKATEETK